MHAGQECTWGPVRAIKEESFKALLLFFFFPFHPKPAFTVSRKRNAKLFCICSHDRILSEAQDAASQ